MAQRPPVPTHSEIPTSRVDAWHAFGALVAGVLVYGLIGWALDDWLGTSFLVVVGILTGAGLGIFMTWKRFIAPQ
jgi:ATP synthase protein I